MSGRFSLLVVGAALLLAGCSGARNAKRTPPPEWVSQRPISRTHYIGIGSAVNSPIPGEALRMAKERAAADLAGEIAVRVESASLLESEERNGQIREDFNSTISSRSEERIAGFEVMGVYEGETGTHVFYRLDKGRHAAAREARRQAAMDLAVQEWSAGQADAEAGRIAPALEHWGTGILALEEFWNEVNRAEVEGENVALESHLLRAMRETMRNLRVDPAVDQVVLSAQGGFQFPLGLHCTLDGRSVSGVPLGYAYHNGTYRKRATEFTDDEGMIVALLQRVDAQRPDRDVVCTLDVERLMDAAHLAPVVVDLIGDIARAEVRVPLDIEMPSVKLAPAPGSDLTAQQLRPLMEAMRKVLLDGGFDVAESAEDSDYWVEFNLRTERRTPTADLGQFHTAYLEGTLTLRKADGRLVEETRIDRVKGVQLNPEAALQLALSNAAETVEKKHGRALLDGMR